MLPTKQCVLYSIKNNLRQICKTHNTHEFQGMIPTPMVPYHTHFEFLLHFFRKFYSTGVYGGSKHYVINIHLSYKKIILTFLHIQGLVGIPFSKSSIQEIICKLIILCSRCLFQSIECQVQPIENSKTCQVQPIERTGLVDRNMSLQNFN